MLDIAKAIRVGRARKNLSQTELAKLVGVVPSAVSAWESGKKIPSGDVLVRIAQELDLVPEIFPAVGKKESRQEFGDRSIGDELREIKARIACLDRRIAAEAPLAIGMIVDALQRKEFLESLRPLAREFWESLRPLAQEFQEKVLSLFDRKNLAAFAVSEGMAPEQAESYVDQICNAGFSENQEFWNRYFESVKSARSPKT